MPQHNIKNLQLINCQLTIKKHGYLLVGVGPYAVACWRVAASHPCAWASCGRRRHGALTRNALRKAAAAVPHGWGDNEPKGLMITAGNR